MAPGLTTRLRIFWRRMKSVDVIAIVFLILYGGLLVFQLIYARAPQSSFLTFLATCALIYLAVRAALWAKEYLLWSLRNRLITAYVFIAVVPVLLLLAMG